MKPSAPKKLELAAIMQRLAPDYDRSDIERFANALAVSAVFDKAAERASHGRKGKNAALVEMRQLNERAIALLRQFEGMDAISAVLLDKKLKKNGLSVLQERKNLCAFADACAAVHAVIGERPYEPSREGRPKKTAGKEIARDAAQYFETLTGKPPTRSTIDRRPSGQFHLFLQKIFEALEPERKLS